MQEYGKSCLTIHAGIQDFRDTAGDLYVGSMSDPDEYQQLITEFPVQGITQGIQLIISYNYGAGNEERVEGYDETDDPGMSGRNAFTRRRCNLCTADLYRIIYE